ncbi:hypothetical protein FF38_13539 [Lucilia cuprina]|uniref:Uncharacterized protein n=1 Tax=Lucilia cuprina TaxID=7375 RepID=A0A0L0BPS9_LUCCU|nr:hypothetical protein FF38_13539 [Lucilia cuprina]
MNTKDVCVNIENSSSTGFVDIIFSTPLTAAYLFKISKSKKFENSSSNGFVDKVIKQKTGSQETERTESLQREPIFIPFTFVRKRRKMAARGIFLIYAEIDFVRKT